MSQTCEHIELVVQARRGDINSLHRLAEVADPRLREFVYRVTLQEDLTKDIVQESLLEMLRIFSQLRDDNRFWYWLYGIAMNKIRRHKQQQYRHRTASLSDVDIDERGCGDQTVANVIGRELREIIVRCMEQIEPRHRAILTMRCYNQMPYSEIAVMMGCTEFGARALFYRAKKSLASKLSGYGFGKGTLLAGLLLFGKITARSEAVAASLTIPAESLHVGVAASLAAMATTKTAIVTMAAAGLVTTSTVVIPLINHDTPTGLNQESTFTASTAVPQVQNDILYYFPDDPQGPVMIRMRPSSEEGQARWNTMQNAQGNYVWTDNSIYMVNYHYWNPDLTVALLPTDTPETINFITTLDKRTRGIQPIAANGQGVLVMSSGSDGQVRTSRQYNALHEDYFQLDPPTGVAWVDQRDAIHQRGWTYFKIEGQIQGQIISGRGCIPFIYDVYAQHSPWLDINVGNRLHIADSDNGAFIRNQESSLLERFPAGTFFKGLPRPWMGLHTLDTVRRDAAQGRIAFRTEATPDQERVQVDLYTDSMRLAYTIHLRADCVECIDIFKAQDRIGTLRFTCLQEISPRDKDFIKPRLGTRGSTGASEGSLWLVRLAEGTLVP